jgi:hypothetical protein
VIFRVLAAKRGRARRYFRELKKRLKEKLVQEEILIVEKDAKVL